ncbi:LLM class flavin-dependent oxidoreductase [Paracoccaceae bacterium GXU_MW_L88]
MHYSMLDLAPILEGAEIATSLRNSIDLAKTAEAAGYHRFWLAEHHSIPSVASAATSVLIGQVAAATSRIRVGAGGIMLPNHAPLVIAEQFGTLASLFPNRIDLGLGRAPGGDMAVMRALRRKFDGPDSYPEDVVELMHYLGPHRPDAAVRALPGEGTEVPIWVLGSSLYGAQMAAHFGLPYAFASHFAPGALEEAIRVYRSNYRPSPQNEKPHLMLAANVFAAETDAEAERLSTSMQLAFARLRSGNPGPLQPPVEDVAEYIPAPVRAGVAEAMRVSAIGGPERLRSQLSELIATYQPDEIILTSQIYDHEARKTSITMAAEAMREIA